MTIDNFNQPVANNIQKIISKKGLKQVAVARMVGISTQAFNDMLNGRRIIKVSEIMNISSVLGVELSELFKCQSNNQPS